MWVDVPNWKLSPSWQEPLTPPSADPSAAPYVYVYFNSSWLQLVLGAVMQLAQPATWDASGSALAGVLGQVTDLLAQIGEGNGPMPVQFQFTATGVLQYSTDGGATWATVGALLMHGSGAPSGSPSLPANQDWAIYQEEGNGTLWFYSVYTRVWVRVLTTADVGVAGGVAALDGSAHLPLSYLSGITTSQLSASAGITGSQLSATAGITSGQIASLADSKITYASQSANLVFASPNGASGAPTYRALVAGDIAVVNPSALTGSGTVPLAALSGITTSQLAASAGIVAAQIASVNPSALTGSGIVPSAALSDATTTTVGVVEIDAAPTSGHPIALTSRNYGVAGGTPQLDGSSLIKLTNLAGITTSQLSATAGILGSQLAASAGILGSQLSATAGITSGQITSLVDSKITYASESANLVHASPNGSSGAPTWRALAAADITAVNPSALTGSGTVPLAALSGITTSQLSATAGIVAGQITSVNPSALTGTGTVPVAGLPVMVGVGASHAAGIVPDPGSSGTATDYLGRDGTWKTIPSSYTLPDATTTTTGGVEIHKAASGAHPVALTTDDLNAASGVPGLDSVKRLALTLNTTLAANDTTAAFQVVRSETLSGNALTGDLIFANDNPSGGSSSGNLLYIQSASNDRFKMAQTGQSFLTFTDANTAIPSSLLTFQRRSTGTPAAGFGGGITFAIDDSTNVLQNAGSVSASWATATHGSVIGRLGLFGYDFNATRREGMRIEGTGTAAAISFYGANAVAKQTITGSRDNEEAFTNLMTALANLGLVTDSSTGSLSQAANLVHASPNGASGAPIYRALVAADIGTVNPSALTGSGTVPSAALPTASTSALGAVKVDGTTVTISAGVITAHGSVSDATTTTTGGVEIRTAASGAHPVALTTDDLNAASGVAQLDASSLIKLSNLSGITFGQLSGTAGILGTQLASATIQGSNIASGTIAGSNILSATITGDLLSLTHNFNSLLADVSITSANTFFDGASLTLGAGTWLIISTVSVLAGSTSAILSAKLWNGSSVYAHTQATPGSTSAMWHATLAGIATQIASSTFRISVASSTASGTIKAAGTTNSPGNFASSIVAIRVG